MYTETLLQSGLTKQQALVYETLLSEGPQRAGTLAKELPIKRGLVYKTLDELIEMNLVEKHESEGEVAVFHPKHPLNLKDIVQRREQKARDAGRILEGILPSLVSDFNLISGRPGIQYFEGEEGIRQALEDTLTSTEEICAYSDIEAIAKHIPEINQWYAKKRHSLGIQKRGIIIDTPFSRKFLKGYYSEVTRNRFIAKGAFPFGALLQIYDEKVSYITLSEDSLWGCIIHNAAIYGMHKALYEDTWSHATSDESDVSASDRRSNAQNTNPDDPSRTNRVSE
jgi:sugar-specific transcriptional regulator TrmB